MTMKITIFPMHLIVYSFVLWFTDKKIKLWSVFSLFITYHMKISNWKLKLYVLDAVFRKKKTNYSKIFLAMINLILFSAETKKYLKSPYNT